MSEMPAHGFATIYTLRRFYILYAGPLPLNLLNPYNLLNLFRTQSKSGTSRGLPLKPFKAYAASGTRQGEYL